MGAAPISPRCMHAARMPTSLTPGFGASETSPAQLAAAAAAAVPRHHHRHHRPRAWGRRHRASWVRHKPSPASSGSSTASPPPPPPAASMGTTASSKLGPAQAQLAAAAAAAVPRHHHRHHRPRAWGRRHRASWGRHKPNRVTTTATTGREHGDDGIEQAGYGTSSAQLAAAAAAAVPPPPPAASMGKTASSKLGPAQARLARPEAAVAPPPTEAIYQQVSSADYGQRRSKRQSHRRRKHRVSVANGELGRILQPSVAAL
ncbi:hypothetical protein PR003_g15862 [Phytophthora rubi]|uniref:Uncharacterized protein n=1 Tax=Phytophthora rubi TaxID=129364 RepID=A0A6A4ELC6_9STRA|nr:hypothetical protein PR003_g15862 [Phytophthora rubi]